MLPTTFGCGGFFVLALVFYLLLSIRVVKEYERLVVFRLGRLVQHEKGPGICFVWLIIDKAVRISLRTLVMEVPPQDIITRDNVSVKVNAIIYFRVIDPLRAVVEVENFEYATRQLSQTTLRSLLGQAELDELLSERDKLNEQLQTNIETHTNSWGIKVSMVEVKNVDLPVEMQRAMARQAEAEREKRAKIIHAEGEFQASAQLAKAAVVISENPTTLQLRYLQTLAEISAEKNSTIIFPVPIDLFDALKRKIV